MLPSMSRSPSSKRQFAGTKYAPPATVPKVTNTVAG
jgi:hypothetical protein